MTFLIPCRISKTKACSSTSYYFKGNWLHLLDFTKRQQKQGDQTLVSQHYQLRPLRLLVWRVVLMIKPTRKSLHGSQVFAIRNFE